MNTTAQPLEAIAGFAALLQSVRADPAHGDYARGLFTETGLLIGFLLPGDSLLVVLGIVALTAGDVEAAARSTARPRRARPVAEAPPRSPPRSRPPRPGR